MSRFPQHAAVITIAIVGATAAAGCTRPDARAAERLPGHAPTVATVTIGRGDIAQVMTVAAEFRPFQEIEVHAKVAGFVKSISVDVGDRVRAGQLLAVLEIPELKDDLKQDEAIIRRAGDEINRAKADLQRTESAHEIAHLGSTRLAGVMKTRSNLVAQQDIDEATARDRVAEAQVATAQAALASAQGQLEIAKASHDKTQTLFDYARIAAPFDGVITHRYADTGAMIQAGTSSQTQAMPIVRLSQNNRLRLVIPVPESAVSRVRLGSPVDLDVQAIHKTFRGVIARFADRLDTDTRTMHVEVDVPNPTLELVPGMYANASLVLDEAKHVLVAPVEAVDRGTSTPRVLVVDRESRVQPRDVTLGLEADDRVEIRAGLAGGDLVVVGNRSQLKPGTVVVPKTMATTTAVDGER